MDIWYKCNKRNDFIWQDTKYKNQYTWLQAIIREEFINAMCKGRPEICVPTRQLQLMTEGINM